MVKKIVVSDYDCAIEGKCREAIPNAPEELEDEWKLKIARILVAKEQQKRAAMEALSKITPELYDCELPAFEPDPHLPNNRLSPMRMASFREGVHRKRSYRKRTKKRKSKKGKRKTSKRLPPRWTLYTIVETPEEPRSEAEEAVGKASVVVESCADEHQCVLESCAQEHQGVEEEIEEANMSPVRPSHAGEIETIVSDSVKGTQKLAVPLDQLSKNDELKFMNQDSDYDLILKMILPSPAIPSIRSLS
uniref:Uncharacterized protein n=1 Tax=Lotharella oceanica TaxID=641309 RepID=A0A7S2TRC7_9EUKA|mmetsp:Transcript_26447/g.49427  ORF Transcript_26447/g.49427 Transcript_26447/m.49427 type:complete len:248 (+) Transcript_26447:85-828(+)